MVILWTLAALCLLGIGYVIWQYYELKKFRVTSYEVVSDKIKGEICLAVLADLHGFEYGPGNRSLVHELEAMQLDFILIPGDFIVSKYPETYEKALDLLKRMVNIAPVYYSYGNHESRAARRGLRVSKAFSEYHRQAQKAGVIFLNNDNRQVKTPGGIISLGGLEISLDYYEKGQAVPMADSYVPSVLGKARSETFQLLLAHNPMYSPQYASWGADVTLCGHNHGGLVCIPGIGSILSPQLTWFPAYHAGEYQIGKRLVIVSRGLGTHTFHIRVNNRAELLCVKLIPGEHTS